MITKLEPSDLLDQPEPMVAAEPVVELAAADAVALDGPGSADIGWAQRARERGMVTAEWAIGVVVAVSLAGLVLLFVVKGPGRELLTNVILKIITAVSSWGLSG